MQRIFGIVMVMALFFSTGAMAYAAPWLLPLGDSITRGWPPEKFPNAYRGYLQEKLGSDTYDFIGPFRSGDDTIDPDHAGVAGEETSAILGRLRGYLDGEFSNAPSGSAILIHAGTNDINNGNSAENAFENIRQMVETIVHKNKNVTIYLSTIVPIVGGANSAVQVLNEKIRQYAKSSQYVQLHIVDHYSAFVAQDQWESALMDDTVHPNARGLERMAETWANAMVAQGTSGVQQQQAQEYETASLQSTSQGVLFDQDCESAALPAVRNAFLVPARDTDIVCKGDVVFVAGREHDYTYKTAWVTVDGNRFTMPVSLTGKKDPSGQWIIGPAEGSIPYTTPSRGVENYIATYSCRREGDVFRCGCKEDGTCSDPYNGIFYWFIKSFYIK